MADDNSSIFSEEVLASLEQPNLFNQKAQGPVIVLGQTFANDEERRAYFREELRKKLPELKKIEGFPIGEDEDIINLSDPPYYTACPNPWLNDFIKEWEEEKKQLVKEGKRVEEKEVKEPYASDVSEGKNNPVYTAHTYHTKVPHPAIMRYILHYTEPGDIVFDGFAGTGMTGVAAQACGNPTEDQKSRFNQGWKESFQSLSPKWGQRHAICGDLSPYASLISYNYNTPVDSRLLKLEMSRIIKEVNDECGWMYATKQDGKPAKLNCVVWSDVCVCNTCGKEYIYWKAALNKKNKCIDDRFSCPHCQSLQDKNKTQIATETIYDQDLNCTITTNKSIPVLVVCTTQDGKRYEREASEDEIRQAKEIDGLKPKYFYPVNRMPEGGETRRNDKHGITHVHQFYTKRNLIALATLLSKIESSPINNHLKFIFTGMINRSTKMNRVHVSHYFNGGGGWNGGHLKGTLYVPNAPVETSILDLIEDRVNGYLRAISQIPPVYDNGLYIGSAECCPIKSNSIDYIFVDPPFGSNIAYSELNTLPEYWLKVATNNATEAIENVSQNKDNAFYLGEMQRCFAEFYRILKPNKWMTVEFSNTSSSVWNSIQRAITSAGFVISNVSSLDKKQGGMRSITTSTAVRQDLAISCYKPSETIQNFAQSSDLDSNIWTFVEEHLQHLPIAIIQGKSTTAVVERSPRIIFDRLISYFVERGLPVPIDASDFQVGLRERYIERDGMFFTASQVTEYEEKKKSAPEFISMGIVVSNESDGIEWLRIHLKDPKTYQEIQPEWMQAINGIRKYDILPELRVLLDENFIQEPDGKWRLPNIQDDVDKEALRTKALLKEFEAYKEAALKPRGRITEARVEAIRAGFKQCYIERDFQTIVTVGQKIPQNLLTEDEILLQFYDIAVNHV